MINKIYLWIECTQQDVFVWGTFTERPSGWSCDWVKQAVSKPELFGLQPNQTKAPFQKMILFQKILFSLNNALRKSAFPQQKKCNGLPTLLFFFFFNCIKTSLAKLHSLFTSNFGLLMTGWWAQNQTTQWSTQIRFYSQRIRCNSQSHPDWSVHTAEKPN